jgi:dihydrofolate reductase
MAKLSYSGLISLDGYVNDASGGFDWAMPTEEVHAFVNDIERPNGIHLYGRRLYEVLSAWETMDVSDEPVMQDYAQLWKAADKVVFSTTLDAVSTPRTRLERTFDPTAIRELKQTSATDIAIGGPTLAAHALRAGLVDELHLTISPVVVGGGTRFLPDDVRLDLELLDQRRFANGVAHLHYRVS